VRLAPAEAMRPPAPDHYRRTLLERLGIQGMPPALRMIVRNLERRPLRSALAVLGIATAVAIVVYEAARQLGLAFDNAGHGA